MPWTWVTSCSSNWNALLSPQILAFSLTEAGGNNRTENVERGFSESWLNKSLYSWGDTWPDFTYPCETGPRRHIAEPMPCARPFLRHLILYQTLSTRTLSYPQQRERMQTQMVMESRKDSVPGPLQSFPLEACLPIRQSSAWSRSSIFEVILSLRIFMVFWMVYFCALP